MSDITQLSDAQLTQLYQQALSNSAIATNESGNAPVTANPVNAASGAQSSMQVLPSTGRDPGFGVKPSNGTPEDDARMGRDYMSALTNRYGDGATAAVAYNWGPGNADKWVKNGADITRLPDETLKYLYNYQQQTAAAPQVQPSSPDTGAPAGFGAPSAMPPTPPAAPLTTRQRALAAIAGLKPPDFGPMAQALQTQLGLTARAIGNGMANGAGALTQGFTRAMGVPDVQPIISNAVNSVTPAPQGAVQNAVQAIGSQVANPVNYAVPGGGVVRSAIGSALAAGMQPAPRGVSPADVAKNMLIGGATGVAMRAAGNVLQGAALRPAAQDLVNQGVRLTPGQALGGVTNSLEQKATSVPVLGELIGGARSAAVRDMNTALGNQVLSPIGQKIAPNTPTRELVDQVGSRISAEYDRILPQITFRVDPQLAQDMAPVMQRVQGMPPDAQNAFMSSWTRNFQSQLTPRGTMPGTAFKDADSAWGLEARNFSQSQDAYQRNLGAAMMDAQTALRNSLQRTNPNAPALGPVNQAWRNYTVLRNAGARVNNPESPIQPGQLQAAVKAGAGAGPAGRGAFASGNANMQGLGDNATAVLGSSVPDSGTPGRGALMAVPAATYGLLKLAAAGHPVPAAALGTGLLGGAAAYGTNAGRQAMLAAITRRTPGMQGVGAGMGMLAPAAGAAAGNISSDRNADSM